LRSGFANEPHRKKVDTIFNSSGLTFGKRPDAEDGDAGATHRRAGNTGGEGGGLGRGSAAVNAGRVLPQRAQRKKKAEEFFASIDRMDRILIAGVRTPI